MAACQVVRMPWPGHEPVRWAHAANLWVDPEYRRRGIGRALMTELLQWAREQDMARVVLNPSEMSKPLYASLGLVSSDLLIADLS